MGNQLKGVIGSKGVTRGVARVILSEEQFSKFREGEILVTEETKPAFVPIMKKAKAVVTDSGGVLCHAAIIARELGIPCLVGVKRATKILSDGEKIEVNADLGTITKLG